MNGRDNRRRKGVWMVMAAVVALVLPAWVASGVTAGGDDDGEIATGVYDVRYLPLPEAVDLVSGLLSEEGSLSIQPRQRRLVVRDRAGVLDRVAEVLGDSDLPPREVNVTVALMLGSDRRAREAGRHVPSKSITREMRGVEETLRDFTKWTEYEQLGKRSVTCPEGGTAQTNLSDEYRVSFRVETVEGRGDKETVILDEVVVERLVPTPDGGTRVVRMPATRIRMGAGRQVLVGAAQSPDANQAVFLMIRAEPR